MSLMRPTTARLTAVTATLFLSTAALAVVPTQATAGTDGHCTGQAAIDMPRAEVQEVSCLGR